MSIIGLLVAFVLVCLAFWVVREVSEAFKLPPTIVKLVYVIMVVFVVIWLLNATGLLSSGPVIQLR